MPVQRRYDSRVPALAWAVAVLLLMLLGAFVTEVVRQKAHDEQAYLLPFGDFEGFINYGSPIQTTATDNLGVTTTIVLTESRIEQPVFSTRKVGWWARSGLSTWWYTAERVMRKPLSPRDKR